MKANLNSRLVAVVGLAVVGLVIGVGGFLLAIHPQQKKSSVLDEKIAEAQAQYAALHTAGSTQPELHAVELFQLSRAMPDTDDMPGILLTLSRLAGQSGVTVTGIQPQPRVALADGSSALPLHLSMSGTWPQVTRFIRGVDEQVRVRGHAYSVGGRLFDIDNVQIDPGETAATVTATFTLTAFDYGAPPSPSATFGAGATTSTTTTTTSSSGSQQAAGTPGSGS